MLLALFGLHWGRLWFDFFKIFLYKKQEEDWKKEDPIFL